MGVQGRGCRIGESQGPQPVPAGPFCKVRELVLLYWQIGRDILTRQNDQGWGSKVIDRLAQDLRAAFPDIEGFSPRNLKYMRAFAEAGPEAEFVQQAAAQLPWGHNLVLLDKLPGPETRRWYILQAVKHSWSRNTLMMHIENRLLERSGKAVSNFESHLPKAQSDLARETLKDPYRVDFLSLGLNAQERDIENALIKHVTDFLLELGAGFAFVGRQVLLNVGGDEFFVDLLFYHLKLRCYVVIELKAGKFKPEHLGKLSFYLAAVDAEIKHPQDGPTIGLLLCKGKMRWWLNMHCAITTDLSAWRNINWWNLCPQNCKPVCRVLSRSNGSWRARGGQATEKACFSGQAYHAGFAYF